MNISDRGNAAQLIAALDKVGAKAPAAVTESYATTVRVSQAVREIGVRPETIYPAVAAALTRGDDPILDADVMRILVSGMISNPGVTAGVEDIAFTAFREVAAELADSIVAAFAKPFDRAAAELVTAHDLIGDVPLEDSDTILRIGGDAPAQWAKAQAAAATITSIVRGWVALADFTRHPTDPIRHQVLRVAAVDFQTWQTGQLEGKHADPWAAILEGLTLSLPTYSEYAERVDTIVQGAERAAAEYQQDNQAYMTGRRPPIRVGS
jgi:hypothetical protein